ncbi:MAG: cysteine hydrolase [Planctomycetes bacterium]|nr:cysteine hydrolase [Planctomycetota bacterium]
MSPRQRFPRTTAFFDVDTQRDFMVPSGALYVRGARAVSGNIRRLVAYAAERRLRIFASTDAHVPGDPEMQRFPPHCMLGTAGQRKIAGTVLRDRAIVPFGPALDARGIAEALQHQQVIIEKQSYDVFDNPSTAALLRASGAKHFVVFGVATDFCVRAAVLGLLKEGYKVTVVCDAIRGIVPEDTARALDEMRGAGARFTTTDRVL